MAATRPDENGHTEHIPCHRLRTTWITFRLVNSESYARRADQYLAKPGKVLVHTRNDRRAVMHKTKGWHGVAAFHQSGPARGPRWISRTSKQERGGFE